MTMYLHQHIVNRDGRVYFMLSAFGQQHDAHTRPINRTHHLQQKAYQLSVEETAGMARAAKRCKRPLRQQKVRKLS